MKLIDNFTLTENFALIIQDWKAHSIDYVITTRIDSDIVSVDVYVPNDQYELALVLSEAIQEIPGN